MGVVQSRLLEPSKLRKNGFFSGNFETGILAAGVAAETASAGHLIALRNSKALAFYVTFMRLWWQTTTAPSSGQRFGVAVKKLTAYSVAHTGGTGAADVALFARDVAYASRDAASGADGSGVVTRVAGTDALTAGTQTIGARIASVGGNELVAAATVPVLLRERVWQGSDKHPVAIIKNTEGLLVANQVLTANALAAIVGLEVMGYFKDAIAS